MLSYAQRQAALVEIAAAINDPNRTVIGDPRNKQYKVAVQFASIKEAVLFAKHLVPLGVEPSSTIIHEKMFGDPLGAIVNVYGKESQRRLLRLVADQLHERPRKQLEDLVLARGPIPDDILERMVKARERKWSPAKTAEKMNEQGIIAGMGGARWTAPKVKKALASYDEQHGPWSGAVEPGV